MRTVRIYKTTVEVFGAWGAVYSFAPLGRRTVEGAHSERSHDVLEIAVPEYHAASRVVHGKLGASDTAYDLFVKAKVGIDGYAFVSL